MRKNDGKKCNSVTTRRSLTAGSEVEHNDTRGTCLSVEQGKIQVPETRTR
jgi:hypothetical protein